MSGFELVRSGGPARTAGALVLALAMALSGVLSAAGPAQAQQAGSITGVVRDAQSLAPLRAAQVFLPGTTLGTLAGEAGRYLIPNVPAGTYQVRVERIGYAVATQPVTVTAGSSSVVNFDLQTEALRLDEIVVTGQAGAARRREVGNSVTQVDIANVAEPVANVESLLQGRAPGLSLFQSGAHARSSTMIRLRGNVSMSQSNQPLVYVDGVRIRAEAFQRNIGPEGSHQSRGPNTTLSPLTDIDPATIERVEIIKGAAATTLYGTEAAAGVIQIFTKRGTPGRTRWTVELREGFTKVLPYNFRTPDVVIPTGTTAADPLGDKMTAPRMRMDPFLRTGHQQSLLLTAQGQAAGLRYFLSGTYNDDEYAHLHDQEQKVHLRGNFGLDLFTNLNLQLNTSYTTSHVQNTPCGNNSSGICLNAYRASSNYIGGAEYWRFMASIDYDLDSYIDHLITGGTLTYQPSSRFTNRLTLGYDRAFIEHRNYRPYGYIAWEPGSRMNGRFLDQTLTADYAGSYQIPVATDLAATVSWGGQAIETEETGAQAYSEGFPGPGVPTVTSGAVKIAGEDLTRVINAGFFGQVMLGFKDRFFVTAGLRMDGNSAFGEALGLESYPKVSASWVVSDEPWWSESLGSLKLRAAYGQSGRAPGAFDAVRTWQPTTLGSTPGFLPQNAGNPNLGPERTAEVELGADLSVLSDRLRAEFTWYQKTTSDALFEVRSIPSLGSWSDQLENVGEIDNKGIELSLKAAVLQMEDWGVDLGVGVATNYSEIVSLGGAPSFSLGGNSWVIEGQPAPVIRGRCVTNAEEFAAPVVQNNCIYGPNSPTTIITPDALVRFPGGITLSGRGEYLGGYYMQDGVTPNGISRSIDMPLCYLPDGRNSSIMIIKGDVAELNALMRARCDYRRGGISQYWIYDASFFKLRDLTLTVPLTRFLRVGESSTLSLSARNAIRWYNQDWWGFDPEMSGNFGAADDNSGVSRVTRSFNEQVPAGAVFTAALRVNF